MSYTATISFYRHLHRHLGASGNTYFVYGCRWTQRSHTSQVWPNGAISNISSQSSSQLNGTIHYWTRIIQINSQLAAHRDSTPADLDKGLEKNSGIILIKRTIVNIVQSDQLCHCHFYIKALSLVLGKRLVLPSYLKVHNHNAIAHKTQLCLIWETLVSSHSLYRSYQKKKEMNRFPHYRNRGDFANVCPMHM